MPSDSNGVFSLPDGYLARTGETIQASQHNPPLEDIASAITARLMRSGAAPMTGPLKITDGSVGSPAIQFANAPSTGFYKTANGFGVSINGTSVVELTAAGLSKGGHYIGELIPWTLLSAPSLCVLPYGQTLSRTTYAELWAIAQAEIAAGNTFYNNGDGSTTFGIGDLRGRVVAGKDNMGGTAAGRLTTVTITGPTILGATGGVEAAALTQAQLPAIKPALKINDLGHYHQYADAFPSSTSPTDATGGPVEEAGPPPNMYPHDLTRFTVPALTGITAEFLNNLGSGEAHSRVQPTLICNFILFVGA